MTADTRQPVRAGTTTRALCGRLASRDMPHFVCILLGLVLLSWSLSATPANESIKVLLGSQRASAQMTRGQLREIYFLRETRWPDGSPIRVFVLPDAHPLHIRFAKEILGVFPYQLRSAWDRTIFSGTGVPPTTVESLDEMRRRVADTPGAIGYAE